MSSDNYSMLWSIEARAFKIPYTPFTHNFWALTAAGCVVDQIHGLAVDPNTGQTKAIGSSHDQLLVVNDPTICWSLQPKQPTTVCDIGSEAAITHRWQAALRAIPALNALKLPYPDLWQHLYKENSNSVFNTIGQIMGFATPALLLPTNAPGINRVISHEIIAKYGIKNPHQRTIG